MKNYCVGVLLCFLIASRSFAQCPLPPNNQFKPFKGGEDKPSGHFEWYSAAGENPTQGGGHPTHVFDRKVTNLSSTTTLKYNWPVGRMHNDALPAGKADPFCHEYGWPNQNHGPLNYGRGNDKTDTTVWEGNGEPPPQAIRSAFTFNILEKGSIRTIPIQVQSSVQPTSKGAFSYTYIFENMSGNTVTVEWDIKKDESLLRDLQKKGFAPVFSIEEKREITFESPLHPVAGFRGVNILLDKIQMAGAEVPILLPKGSL